MDELISSPPTEQEKLMYSMGPDWELQSVNRRVQGTGDVEAIHMRNILVSLTYINRTTGFIQTVPVHP